MIFINAKNKILGRVCTKIAKTLLESEDQVVVVNSKDTIISGPKKNTFERYDSVKDKKGKGNPSKNRKNLKYPDQLLKRSVRGMLPRSPRGNAALKRLRVYIDCPEHIDIKKVPKADELPKILHVSLGDLSLHLGAKLKQ